jgi:hypothetical protein
VHLVDSLLVDSGIGHEGRQNKSGRFAQESKLQGQPLLFFFIFSKTTRVAGSLKSRNSRASLFFFGTDS